MWRLGTMGVGFITLFLLLVANLSALAPATVQPSIDWSATSFAAGYDSHGVLTIRQSDWLPQVKHLHNYDLANVGQTSIVVSVLSDNEFYVGRDRSASSEMSQRIMSMRCSGNHEEEVVFIKAGRLIEYRTIVGVLYAIREAGFDRVGLVVRNEAQGNELGAFAVMTTELRRVFVPPPPCKKVLALVPPPPPTQVAAGTKLPDKDDPCGRFAPDPQCDRIIVPTTRFGPNRMAVVNWLSMTLTELAQVLKISLEHRPDKTVFLKARKVDKYDDVIRMIDVIRDAGGMPVALQIDSLD